mgnify:CR=1 FL=1
MNSNWFKLVMKMTKIEYGKNLLLKGVPIIFNKGGAKLKIGENTTIKSSFLSNLVGLTAGQSSLPVHLVQRLKLEIMWEFQVLRFTPARRSRLVRIPALVVTARFWIMTSILLKQKPETNCSGMKMVVTVIWCQAEKSRSVRTVSSGATV